MDEKRLRWHEDHAGLAFEDSVEERKRTLELTSEIRRLREVLPDPDALNSLATWLDRFCPKATESGVQARVRRWAHEIASALRGEDGGERG